MAYNIFFLFQCLYNVKWFKAAFTEAGVVLIKDGKGGSGEGGTDSLKYGEYRKYPCSLLEQLTHM